MGQLTREVEWLVGDGLYDAKNGARLCGAGTTDRDAMLLD
jgi:hypothetical protein